MRIRVFVCSLLGPMIMLVGPWLQAGSNLSDQFEKRITAEFAAESPEAADLFSRASEAREKEDHKTASKLYSRVQLAADL